jgi:hypothetical protein
VAKGWRLAARPRLIRLSAGSTSWRYGELHRDGGRAILDPQRRGAPDLNRSFELGTWDAREWLAGLVGCERTELAVRSIDRYGPKETQIRYERGDEAVARLIVEGPVVPMGVQEGRGTWHVSVRIGTGSEDVHSVELPETEEIVY